MDALRIRICVISGLAALTLTGGCSTLETPEETTTRLLSQPTEGDRLFGQPSNPSSGKADAPIQARGQAPDGLKVPTTLPPIREPELPPPAATSLPTAIPTSANPGTTPNVTPTSYSPGMSGNTLPQHDPLREKQVQIAAYIGTSAVITEDEVWQMVRHRARDYITLTGKERAAKEKAIYQEELGRIVERELVIIELTSRLKKNKKDDILRELLDAAAKTATKRMNEIRKSNNFPSEEVFLQALRAQGFTYKGMHRQLERETLAGIFLEQTLREKVKFITLNDLWDYYQENSKDFMVEDRAKWLDLFIPFNLFPTPAEAKTYADGVWRQASTDADFHELVKKYGRGDSNLRDGEGIGQKHGEIQPRELEPVIFKMDAGQISPLLQTATGYHIVKVVERDKAGVKPFDQKIQIEVRERLGREVEKTERARLMDELWRKYRPKIVE